MSIEFLVVTLATGSPGGAGSSTVKFTFASIVKLVADVFSEADVVTEIPDDVTVDTGSPSALQVYTPAAIVSATEMVRLYWVPVSNRNRPLIKRACESTNGIESFCHSTTTDEGMTVGEMLVYAKHGIEISLPRITVI